MRSVLLSHIHWRHALFRWCLKDVDYDSHLSAIVILIRHSINEVSLSLIESIGNLPLCGVQPRQISRPIWWIRWSTIDHQCTYRRGCSSVCLIADNLFNALPQRWRGSIAAPAMAAGGRCCATEPYDHVGISDFRVMPGATSAFAAIIH